MISTQDVETLPGTPVLDSDGDKVGDVAQVYVSDEGSEPLFVTVKTGLFGTKETFVPLDEATLVQGALHVRYDKATIKDAPRVEADDHLSDDEQDGLFDYYDQHGGAARELDRSAAAGPGRSDDTALADRIGDDSSTTGLDRREDVRTGGIGSDDRDAFTGSDPGRDAGAMAGAGAAYDASGADAFGGASGGTQDAVPTGADQPEGEREARRTDDHGIAGAGATGDGSVAGGTGSGIASPGSVQRTADDDGSLTLSEERMNVGTQRSESGRARLRKHVVTEQRTVTVPVSHDEVRIEREPIGADEAASMRAGEIGEDEREVVLTEERPVVDTEVVPVERVRLSTEQVTEQRDVTGQVRREQLDDDGLQGGADR